VSFAHPGWRVERTARGEDARAWQRVLESFDTAGAKVLKEDRGTAVYRTSLLGRDLVLKSWELRTLGSRLRALARAGQPDRHWRGAAWLNGHGFRAAHCLALASEYRSPFPRRWLVMEAVPGRSVLDHLARGDLTVRQEHAVARALGRQLTLFVSHARSNRDHKPSNLIVSGDPANPEIVLIDCVGLRNRVDTGRMLASLAIEPAGCGVPVRASLAMRVLRSHLASLDEGIGPMADLSRRDARRFRNGKWRDVIARIRAHGDPSPRVNPLAGAP